MIARIAILFAMVLTPVVADELPEEPTSTSRVKVRLQFISAVNDVGSAYIRDLDVLAKHAAENADVGLFESLRKAGTHFEATGLLSTLPTAEEANHDYVSGLNAAINNLSRDYKKMIATKLIEQQVSEAKTIEKEMTFIMDAVRPPAQEAKGKLQATLVLTDGRSITGELVGRTPDSFTLRVPAADRQKFHRVTIRKSNVKTLTTTEIEPDDLGLLTINQLTGHAQQMLKRLAEDSRLSNSTIYLRYRDPKIADVLVNLKTGDRFVERDDDPGEFESVEDDRRRGVRWDGLTPMPADNLLEFIQKEGIEVPIYIAQSRSVGSKRVADGRDARGRPISRTVDVKRRSWSHKSHAFNRHLEQSKRLAKAKQGQPAKPGQAKVAPFDDPPFMALLKRIQKIKMEIDGADRSPQAAPAPKPRNDGVGSSPFAEGRPPD